MKKMNTRLLALACAVFVLSACNQEADITKETAIDVIAHQDVSEEQPLMVQDFTPVKHVYNLIEGQERFDWENLMYGPQPADQSPIPFPWNPEANVQFSNDIRYDVKKEDGWVLCYTNFSSTNKIAGHAFIMLYNQYRGLVRYYFYQDMSVPQDYQAYKVFNSIIGLEGAYGSNSPMLNFASQQMVDMDRNTNLISTLETQAFTENTWYATEVEMAFDKHIYQQVYPNIVFTYDFSMIQATNFELNGKPTDVFGIKVRAENQDFNTALNFSGHAQVMLYNQSDIENAANIFNTDERNMLNSIINTQSYDGLLSGTVQSSTAGEVMWNADLLFSKITAGAALAGPSFAMIGTDQSQTKGARPLYAEPMGVFYLNQKPKVLLTELSEASHPYEYKLDVKSVHYLFNPSVLEIADIQNVSQEVVATQEEALLQNQRRATLYQGQTLASTKPLTVQGVRVSFDVVPKDGSKTVHIVKTFKAIVEKQ